MSKYKKVILACDHAGYSLKEAVTFILKDLNYQIDDIGCHSTDSVDYPDYAQKLCYQFLDGEYDAGILLCGSGIGMSMAANRFPAIRAVVCTESASAKLSREHNDANVLCLGARLVDDKTAQECIKAFLETEFQGGRHEARVQKIDDGGEIE